MDYHILQSKKYIFLFWQEILCRDGSKLKVNLSHSIIFLCQNFMAYIKFHQFLRFKKKLNYFQKWPRLFSYVKQAVFKNNLRNS
jgi:hypothetical protein